MQVVLDENDDSDDDLDISKYQYNIFQGPNHPPSARP